MLPLRDLLDEVAGAGPKSIIDLGAGAGSALPLLRQRWPDARLIAVDNSPEMLAKIPAAPDTDIVSADIAFWQPETPVDLIISNAALHWLDRHDELFPRLMGWLSQGGRLAVQMPNNWAEPSHQAMFEVAATGPWRERLQPHLRTEPVLTADEYRRILEECATDTRIFEKTYTHRLEGEDAVASWMQGSSLGQLLEVLPRSEADDFLVRYRAALEGAYPTTPEDQTIFPFRRLFIIAVR